MSGGEPSSFVVATEESYIFASLEDGNDDSAALPKPSNDDDKHHRQHRHQGSDRGAAILNFANSLVGAGCIGLGSAIARSGGLASIVAIVGLAYLNKLSADLIIQLSSSSSSSSSASSSSSYEQLGWYAYGSAGRNAVVTAKFLFSYGCLVAYIKIVKDNFPSAMLAMTGWTIWQPEYENWITVVVSASVMLPLCLLRDLKPLERVSAIKFATLLAIFLIILYLYPANHVDGSNNNNNNNNNGGGGESSSFADHWFVVHPGLFASLGTLVFAFVAQHTVNLVYDSLHPRLQTMDDWRIVSTWSLALAAAFSLAIGLAVYITFWDQSSSNIFALYEPSLPVSVTKLLLSFMIMFTYPMPFLSCRELLLVSLPQSSTFIISNNKEEEQPPWWLLEPKQLIRPLHVMLTVGLWASSALLAVLVPSLSDVLDLTGCLGGTAIAFVLPAMFSFQLQGYTHLAASILVIGGTIGLVGTIQSLHKLVQDL